MTLIRSLKITLRNDARYIKDNYIDFLLTSIAVVLFVVVGCAMIAFPFYWVRALTSGFGYWPTVLFAVIWAPFVWYLFSVVIRTLERR